MSFSNVIGVLQNTSPSIPTMGNTGKIGGNVGELLDVSKDRIFIDLTDTVRNFAPTANPYYTAEQGIVNRSAGGNGTSGWPIQDFVAVLLTNSTPADYGTYTVSFVGQATVTSLIAESTIVRLSYSSVNNLTSFGIICNGDIVLQFTGLSSDFSTLKVFRPNYDQRRNTNIFTNEFLNHISDCTVLRFSDWLEVDNSTDFSWDTRSSLTYGAVLRTNRDVGAAASLCSTAGKNGWFQIPHKALPSYLTSWISQIDTYLSTNLTGYLEYSNQTWDLTKTQGTYAYTSARDATNTYTGLSSAGNRIVGAQRASNVVSIQFNTNHGAAVNQVVAVYGISGIPNGQYTITAIPNNKVISFSNTGANTTFTISTTDDSNLVLLNGTNPLSLPLLYSSDPVTTAILMQRFCMQQTRGIWTAAQLNTHASRFKIVFVNKPGAENTLVELLAWTQGQYGTVSTWLSGVATEGFLSLSNPSLCTSSNVVLTQLAASLSPLQDRLAQFSNACASFGVKPMLSRWGTDTSITPNSTVATAVQQALLDSNMSSLVPSVMTAWRNRGGDVAAFYKMGASYTFGVDGANTWSLMQADITAFGQAKFQGYKNGAGLAAAPVSETNITTGTISIPSWFPLLAFGTTVQGSGVLLSSVANVPTVSIQVCVNTTGTYTLTLYAAQNFASTSTVTVKVDGVALTTGLALPNIDITTVQAPSAYSTAVSLTAGIHTVQLTFPVHNSSIALRQLTLV